MSTNLKVIDLGSNSVRLRITKILDDGQTELLRYEKSTCACQKTWVRSGR